MDQSDVDGRTSYAFDTPRMRVKTERMFWAETGALEDMKDGPAEGWPCYILPQPQYEQLKAGKTKIPDSHAMIVVFAKDMPNRFVFWQNTVEAAAYVDTKGARNRLVCELFNTKLDEHGRVRLKKSDDTEDKNKKTSPITRTLPGDSPIL